ncbi:TPA: hypothetical protein LSX69_004702 [Escherichia coli]|nr:hypothetical protein [Escherichia coli]
MTAAWLSSCTSTIQNFVETSTRLHHDKLVLTLQEQIDFDYQINLRLDFRVEAIRHSQAGRVTATRNKLIFFNLLQYAEALKAETRAVLSRQETLREARSLLLSHSYGQICDETKIYSHPQHLCLTENCSGCNGRGQVNCSSCHGSGKTTCFSCGGSGQVMAQRSYYDHYSKQTRTESYYEGCSSCGSSGRRRCNHCSGSGNQQCSPCKGTGEITQITQLNSIAVPKYQLVFFKHDVPTFIKDGLYKAGIPKLAQFGEVKLLKDSVNDEGYLVNFLYNASVPFARFNSSLPQAGNQQIHWIIYGVKPQILDAGHVIELLLKSDLHNLVYSATKNKLLNPFVASFSRKTIRTFMASEAHQDMLEANRSGKSGETLREELNRGFTTTYLDETLNSLKAIMSAIQRWSVFKWAIISSFIMYMVMPIYTAFNRYWEQDAKNIYMTPISKWNTQQELLSSLKLIIQHCGVLIIIIAIIIPALGYAWRRLWVRWRLNKQLLMWSLDKGILRSKWFLSLLLASVFSLALLLINPIWMTQDGLLFGIYPVDKPVHWMLKFLYTITK